MPGYTNKTLKEGYGRLKKTLEKILKPRKEQPRPQLALQPIRNQPTRFRIAAKAEEGVRQAGGR